MRTLIIPSWYPTHPDDINGVFFREQAIALAKHGHQVGVIHPNLRSPRQWRTAVTGKYGVTREDDLGVTTFRSHSMAWFPRMPRGHRWQWLRQGRILFDRYRETYGLPELIHVHSMLNAGMLAMALRQRYGVPYVVTEHSSAFARGAVTPNELKLARSVAANASCRFAVSEPFCGLLNEKLGTQVGTWEPLPNIVDQRFLSSQVTPGAPASEQFRFAAIAVLTENKSIHNLIAAFAHAFAQDQSVFLDIGGDGPELERLKALVEQYGLNGRVQFLGALSRDRVADVISAANALVLASRYETFGVVVIEALALGKPVVATRCGGPESIIVEGDGLLVPVDDVNSLADGLKTLRHTIEDYDAEMIRERCRARYSEAAVVDRLTGIYRSVVAEARVLQAPQG